MKVSSEQLQQSDFEVHWQQQSLGGPLKSGQAQIMFEQLKYEVGIDTCQQGLESK